LLRAERGFDRDAGRLRQSLLEFGIPNSGAPDGLGCVKRSSGLSLKRSRSRPGSSLGGMLGAAAATDMPARSSIAAIRQHAICIVLNSQAHPLA
jgi:hypothetical protein